MAHLINQLIRAARQEPKPVELTIKPSGVRAVATHARLSHALPLIHDAMERQSEIERLILAGEMRFLGVPVRVLGTRRADI